MEINHQEIIPIQEIPPESRLTHENVLRIFDQFRMKEGEYGKRITAHPRFGDVTFSDNKIELVRGTIELFAKQLPDIFNSDIGADSKYAKNIKDNETKEGKPWTTDTTDSLMLLLLIEAIKLGIVVTPLYIDKHFSPKERGNFLFKTQWGVYKKDQDRKKYVYGDAK